MNRRNHHYAFGLAILILFNNVHVAYSFLQPPSMFFPISSTSLGVSEKLINDQNDGETKDFHVPSSSSPYSSSSSRRLHRAKQIESLQGIWWTSDQKDQLVEINSSYAIFDAPQHVKNSNALAIMYPLGGTDDIVTLRTCKLVSTTPIPQWTSSPTTKIHRRAGKTTNVSCWEKCKYPKQYWRSNPEKTVPGYEDSLVNLIHGGPFWSASPVDVVRAFIKCFQGKGHAATNYETLASLCNWRSSTYIGLSHFATISSWSIVKCYYYSPDVCTISVKMICNSGDDHDQFFDFHLTRGDNKNNNDESNGYRHGSKLPPSLLFDSTMDVELCVNGKSWVVEHVYEIKR